MKANDNFNKAFFEIFGVGPAASKEPEKASPEKASAGSAPQPAPSQPAPAAETPTPSRRPATAPEPPAPPRTCLAPGTTIEGQLSAKGDVEVCGEFKGDIASEGGVILRANITGSITAVRLDIMGCCLNGDARISGPVTMDAISSVEGNIHAEEVVCSGRVKGDLHVAGNTTLQDGSLIEGTIDTGSIVMERGARASGELHMSAAKERPQGKPDKR